MLSSHTAPSSEGDLPSSSQNGAIFSDEPARDATPPSSPPGFPWDERVESPAKPLQKPTRNAFSMLGKRKALDAVDENARPAKARAIATTAPTSIPPSSSKSLNQLQLSLGQEVQIKCKTCGMEYVPSSAEDRKLHDKHHKLNTQGYDVGKDFLQKAQQPYYVYPGVAPGDSICMVDCYDTPYRRRRGQTVLEVVQRELGAVEIAKEDIWHFRLADPELRHEPEYATYLYVRETKCIGFLLVQAITEAYQVEEPVLVDTKPATLHNGHGETGPRVASGSLAALKSRQQAAAAKHERLSKAPLMLSPTARPAKLGICRIWTSPSHRNQGIGIRLLDTAYTHYNTMIAKSHKKPSDELERIFGAQRQRLESKDEVAFSQPTEAGTRLARKWFGKMFGWSVYVD